MNKTKYFEESIEDQATRAAINAWCSVYLSNLRTEKIPRSSWLHEWVMAVMKKRFIPAAERGR